MPLAGVGDLTTASRRAPIPVMKSLDTDAHLIPRVDVLQVMYEIRSAPVLDLLPPALNPTIPSTLTWIVWSGESDELGPFRIAQTRVGCRAGVRPRGLLVGAVCEGDVAADLLAARWGYSAVAGEVKLTRYHDRVHATARVEGRTLLDIALLDPEAISGGDVQYVATMNLAETPRGTRLVQVDPEFTFHRAERGRPHLSVFDAAAWGDARIEPCWPVSASVTVADITLPKLRYLCRLDVPAFQGTESLV